MQERPRHTVTAYANINGDEYEDDADEDDDDKMLDLSAPHEASTTDSDPYIDGEP